MSTGTVVCFSGRMGTGKTSVARTLADSLGWPFASFGDYVRAEARRLGADPDDRRELQNIGQRLVEDDPVAFCTAVLALSGFAVGQNLVVDGIRHEVIYRILVNQVAPSRPLLFYLSIAEDVRHARIQLRGELPSASEDHRVESEVPVHLRTVASAILDASGTPVAVTASCLDLLEGFGVLGSTVEDARRHLATLSP